MFPINEIIHLGCWCKLCDYHFDGELLEGQVIHCHLEKIPDLFQLIKRSKKKYVIISSDSDAGLHYQYYHSPALDLYKAVYLYIKPSHGYCDLKIEGRLNKSRCRPEDKYSIKYYSYTECTFNKIPENVVHWFVVNNTVSHPKITTIPLGINGQEALNDISQYPTQDPQNLLYVNLGATTMERIALMHHYSTIKWVTVESKVNRERYLGQISDHKYVLCPPGNGYETHRLWETLYMNRIPIVEDKTYTMYLFQHKFPVLFTPSFYALTKYKLNELHSESSSLISQALYFSYWKDLINQQIGVL